MNILLFGQLAEITGSETIAIGDEVCDTTSLVTAINKTYPGMKDIKYLVAVDKKVVKENTAINASSNIALLPPFSGG